MTVQQLTQAVQSGNLAAVQSILQSHPHLIHKDLSESNEHRALHFAVLRRDAPMVRLLMQSGANARQGIYPHRDATSAFAIASDRNYHEILTIIEDEEHRRTLNPPAHEPESPPAEDELELAIESADAPLIRQLIEANPALLRRINHNGGPLTHAVLENQLGIVRLLLDLGADPDESTILQNLQEPVRSWGFPLWNAARENLPDIATLLLDRGADPNANVYASGWPLLHAWNHPDGIIKSLLLARGAKRQPYMLSESHDIEAARELLASHPSEELANELAWSASDHGCPAILQLALPHLTWPNDDPQWHWILIQPIRGATTNYPSREGHFECMAILLNRGISPNISRYGQTPLHFTAAYKGNVADQDRARFAQMLIQHGASLTLRDHLLQSTPLAWACRWGRVELTKKLLALGAAINEPDAEPWATPTAWATKMNHKQSLELLH